MKSQDQQLAAALSKIWDRVLTSGGDLPEMIAASSLNRHQLKTALKSYRVDDQVALFHDRPGRREDKELLGLLGCLGGLASWFFIIVGIVLVAAGPVGIGVLVLMGSISAMAAAVKRARSNAHSNDWAFANIARDYLRHANPERRNTKPPSRYIADANDAEIAAAEFMRWLGFLDAHATPVGPDGGIDVLASNAVGQVKDYGKPIGRPEIQQHLGVAVGEGGKLPIFFARSGYTNEALGWAAERDMPLFEFDLAGSWKTSNVAAERLWNAGAKEYLKNHKPTRPQSRLAGPDPAATQPPPAEGETETTLFVAGGKPELTEEPPALTEEPSGGLVSELRELAELHNSGVLDEDEFQAAKKKLLD